MKRFFFILFFLLLLLLGCIAFLRITSKSNKNDNKQRIRIGFFPNLTHPQALIAQAKGWFEKYLPENVQIQWRQFNAGPSAMESLFTHAIDVTYVGPTPALNLYARTQGKEVRLLAGAIKGGSGLVLQKDLKGPWDAEFWKGKKIATPQFGNTQDVACRAWFMSQNFDQVLMTPVANSDQLLLFQKHKIDGAWTVEPWLSRLVQNGGQLFYKDDKNWATIFVASKEFYEKHAKLKEALLKAHKELTLWIKNNMEEACHLLKAELKKKTRIDFSEVLIKDTTQSLIFETEVRKEEFQKWLEDTILLKLLPRETLSLNLDAFLGL